VIDENKNIINKVKITFARLLLRFINILIPSDLI